MGELDTVLQKQNENHKKHIYQDALVSTFVAVKLSPGILVLLFLLIDRTDTILLQVDFC